MGADWRQSMNDWLASHAGVISATELNSFGCSTRAIYRMVDRNELAILMPSVFMSPQWPLGDLQLMTAACLRNPSVAVAFLSAAQTWNYRRLPAFTGVHVLVPHGLSPRMKGVTIHRCRKIDEVDIVERSDGIRITSPVRTLFDCADILGDEVAASVLEQVIDRDNGSLVTHSATLARLGHPNRPGTRTMARVIASRPPWRRALQSDLEPMVIREITGQNLPPPEVQYSLTVAGKTIRLDFAWPKRRVALEVDHPFWHAGAEESHRDKHRDRKLTALGWRVVRITSLDVESGLRQAIKDLAAVLEMGNG